MVAQLEKYHQFLDTWCYRILEGEHRRCYGEEKEQRPVDDGLARRASDPGPPSTKLLQKPARKATSRAAEVWFPFRNHPQRKHNEGLSARREPLLTPGEKSAPETAGQPRGSSHDPQAPTAPQRRATTDYAEGFGGSETPRHNSRASSGPRQVSRLQPSRKTSRPSHYVIQRPDFSETQSQIQQPSRKPTSKKGGSLMISSLQPTQVAELSHRPTNASRSVAQEDKAAFSVTEEFNYSRNQSGPSCRTTKGTKLASALREGTQFSQRLSGAFRPPSQKHGSATKTPQASLNSHHPSQSPTSSTISGKSASLTGPSHINTENFTLGNHDRSYIEGFGPDTTTTKAIQSTTNLPGAGGEDPERMRTEHFGIGNHDRSYIEGFGSNVPRM